MKLGDMPGSLPELAREEELPDDDRRRHAADERRPVGREATADGHQNARGGGQLRGWRARAALKSQPPCTWVERSRTSSATAGRISCWLTASSASLRVTP